MHQMLIKKKKKNCIAGWDRRLYKLLAQKLTESVKKGFLKPHFVNLCIAAFDKEKRANLSAVLADMFSFLVELVRYNRFRTNSKSD